MEASLYAHACDIMGSDMHKPPTKRLPVMQAARMCQNGQVLAADDRGNKVAVFASDNGDVFMVPDSCPHDGGLLSDGFVDGDALVCHRHGWEFEFPTGKCVGRPSICVPVTKINT